MSRARGFRQWEARLEEFLALVTPTILGVAVIVPGLDIVMGGTISAFAPWYQVVPVMLLACAITSQTFVSASFGGVALREKRYRDAFVWVVLAIPGFAMLSIAIMTASLQSEMHMSYSAALTATHMTQRTVDGLNMAFGGWVSVVALRLNPDIKQRSRLRDRNVEQVEYGRDELRENRQHRENKA